MKIIYHTENNKELVSTSVEKLCGRLEERKIERKSNFKRRDSYAKRRYNKFPKKPIEQEINLWITKRSIDTM